MLGMIRNERDVRAWMRRFVQMNRLGEMFWIEHRSGASAGLPDLFLANKGVLTPVELKCAPVAREGGNGWRVRLRPSQIRVARALAERGVDVVFVVGFLGTAEVRATRWSHLAAKALREESSVEDLTIKLNQVLRCV